MFSKISSDFSSTLDALLEIFKNNSILFTTLSILLVLYSSMIMHRVPPALVIFINNFYVKFGLIFIVAYMSSHNPLLSILFSLAILLSVQALIQIESNSSVNNLYVQTVTPTNLTSITPEVLHYNTSLPNNYNPLQNMENNIPILINNHSTAIPINDEPHNVHKLHTMEQHVPFPDDNNKEYSSVENIHFTNNDLNSSNLNTIDLNSSNLDTIDLNSSNLDTYIDINKNKTYNMDEKTNIVSYSGSDYANY